MIRDLLEKISALDRQELIYALEEEIAQYIELDGGIFIGVNVEPLQHLIIEEQTGAWACGKVKRAG